MAFDFSDFRTTGPHLSESYVEYLLESEALDRAVFFNRLWLYYKNELQDLATGTISSSDGWTEFARPYYQAQEFGLPARITGLTHLGYGGVGTPAEGLKRKEVVVENDIGWRIDTGVHFLFGQPIEIESLAADAERKRLIEQWLKQIYLGAGGPAFFQEMALLGSVYGFVDVVARLPAGILRDGDQWFLDDGASRRQVEAPALITLENIEAPRIIPILDEDNYHKVHYHIQHYLKRLNQTKDSGPFRWLGRASGDTSVAPATVTVTEILGPNRWQRYEDGELVADGENILGHLPVVHIQNLALPMYYEGISDVEPLIPVQDELNTRLSDRANRVTFQSFKMYLGKGIDNFENRPIAPGRMWSTDNPDASIEAFGGDAECPSETAHIAELREAMDKISGIGPLAAGLLRDRLGNLTSASALKVTLMGTLAKINRKRITYGQGIIELNRLLLELLDRIGALETKPEERETKIHWPSPIPENIREKLEEAQMKRSLGVSQETVLKELGYEA